MHRFDALHQVAGFYDRCQRPDHIGFIEKVFGCVGFVPISQNSHASEAGFLQFNLAFSVFAAFFPEGRGIDLVADFADLFLHLVFDGQPVAVPTRNVRGTKARHQTRFDHDVFQNLVDRVAHVEITIGVGRSIVENPQRAVRGFLLNLMVKACFFPGC